MAQSKHVSEVTLTIEDLIYLDKTLREDFGLDSLDTTDLLMKIEELKNVKIDLY